MNPVDAIDDPVRILKSGQHRMVLAGGRVFLQREVGVEHRTFFAAGEGSSEKRGQPEILPLHTPLIVKRSFIGGDDAATTLHEFTDLLALCRGKRRNIGQDQGAKLIRMLSIEQLVVHHLKGNSGFDECLIETQRRIVHCGGRIRVRHRMRRFAGNKPCPRAPGISRCGNNPGSRSAT